MKRPSILTTFRLQKIPRTLRNLLLLAVVVFPFASHKPTTSAQDAFSDLEGVHDAATCSVIGGWAWNSTIPNTPINVDVYVDNVFLATVAADQFRQDLLDAGKGNGFHAFAFSTPDSLKDGVPHSIRVRISNSSFDLTNSPKTINCSLHDYRGNHETADCSLIGGWAWDVNNPNAHIFVYVYIDGSAAASIAAPANQFRQDLLDAGIGDGTHGFAFQTPPSLKDSHPHTIRIRFETSNIDLPNTPKSINCPPAAEPNYQGSHDRADCNVIAGWAWDANNPFATISVDIYSDNIPLATVPADKFRQDLLDAGIGNGYHAFVFPVPNSLKNGQAHSISVGFHGTFLGLSNTPKTIVCTDTLEGAFDLANCESIAGWAWDSLQPNTPISVDVFSDSTLIATVPANQFRQDLSDAGKGNGFHAFTFPVPPPLKDGNPHTVFVRFAGTALQLSNSPRTLTCSPDFEGVLDAANCMVIGGWAWDMMQPNAPISVDVFGDNILLATVPANQFRQDLLNAGKGNGVHAFTLATPPSLRDGNIHTIVVKIAGTSVQLTNSPSSINNCPP
jgi:hypothetical protein